MSIRVLLVDDHEIVRVGLRSLLAEEADMEIVGEAQTGRQAVSLAEELRPDIIIMDISMPDMNGFEATLQIHRQRHKAKIIVLSMHHKRQFVIDMLKAGISGYILKNKVNDDLVKAIRTAVADEVYISSKVAMIIARDYASSRNSARPGVFGVLTSREREVLQFIAEGKNTKETARHLNISVKTIESTRRQIMQKLDIHNVADLTKYAVNEGITSLDF